MKFLVALLLLSSSPAHAARELTVISSYRESKEALTTDRVGTIDPTEFNPHRQRWVLERHVSLKGLRAEPRADGRFTARADAVETVVKGWVRGPGPWFRPLEQFGCGAKPDAFFATAEGTKLAAQAGSERWEALVREGRDELRILLSRVVSPSEGMAVLDGQQVLEDWVAGLERDWRARGRPAAREKEWNTYLASAKERGLCAGKSKGATVGGPTGWRELMEPPPAPLEPGDGMTSLLARAPARRWNGMYSVRLTVRVGSTRSLSGQFLVDTSAPKTIFDPDWLKGQGVLATWLEIPRAAPEQAVFSGGRGLARRAKVESIELAGYKLPINEVLLRDTEIFSPPDNLAVCCDGVLGMDALRRVVAEFRTAAPAELILWPREGFRAPYGANSRWIEAGLDSSHRPVSSACALFEGHRAELRGIHWSTASEGALEILPSASSKAPRRAPWEVVCDGSVKLADGVVSDPVQEDEAVAVPGASATAGMALLGRGNFIFDFPHGRIWFPAPALAMPVRENRTGLTVAYDYAQGERVLRVANVRPTSRLKPLIQAGLQPGAQILKVDDKPVDEADLWEIDQRLGGAYGKSVELRWKSGKREKKMSIALEESGS